MNFNTITDILDAWLTSNLKGTVNFKSGKDKVIHINASVLNLEHWLMEWRKKHKLNERLDAEFISESILKTVHHTSSDKAFSKKDYQFNFLYFLARYYTPKADLHRLITTFIDKYKDQLSFADIVITETGATRCKTNIRFAVMELRNFGLVLSQDLEGKRSLSPSIPGLVALLNIQWQSEQNNFSFIEKIEDELKPVRDVRKYKGYPCDSTLYDSLQMFKVDGHLYQFLHWLKDINPTKEEKEFLEKIISKYIDFTTAAIIITKNGLKVTKEFSKLSGKFQEELFENHQKNIPFMEKLLAHFQSHQK